MKLTTLSKQLITALMSNGLTYLVTSTTTTILTLILYQQLDYTDFTIWATSYSIVYLLLLWTDLGLRKSIPRYIVTINTNTHELNRFTAIIIAVKLFILIATIPLLTFLLNLTTTLIPVLYTSVVILYLTEGVVATLRLFFHAHFWQNSFNLFQSIFMTIQTLIAIGYTYTITNHLELINTLITVRYLSSGTLCLVAAPLLYYFYHTTAEHTTQKTTSTHRLDYYAFSIHSTAMWLSSIFKSITERNFMVPALATIAGPTVATTYKIANDGALLLQRAILRTVGIADTTALSYAHTSQEGVRRIFEQLLSTMAILALPMWACVVIGWILSLDCSHDQTIMYAFIILTLIYLGESLLIPYERLIEVQQNYRLLTLAYIPYLIITGLLLAISYYSWMGLITCIITIGAGRLICLIILVRYGSQTYQLPYPLTALIKIGLLVVILSCIVLSTMLLLSHSSQDYKLA